jgi:lipopolysaccharide/colanic/teichoic acid biosynthesis glycosyltransferase
MYGTSEDSTVESPKFKEIAQTAREIAVLFSRILALVVLAIYLPALIGASMLVLLTSTGPAFISKAYRRRDGNVVYLYEFRTECWKTYNETPVGAFLRRADLARLPRLANVLLGQILAGERVERIHG